MTDTVTAKLAEWEALANAATEGPWREDDASASVETVWTLEGDDEPQVICDWLEPGDAEFIAAARTAMPALLGFVREVRALHASSEATRGVGQIRDGAWTAYCEEDLEDWPCPTEQAAQKWIGGEG